MKRVLLYLHTIVWIAMPVMLYAIGVQSAAVIALASLSGLSHLVMFGIYISHPGLLSNRVYITISPDKDRFEQMIEVNRQMAHNGINLAVFRTQQGIKNS